MNEIIYTIDNWTLIKSLGGFAVVFSGIILFFSNYVTDRLKQSSQHVFDKRLEELKGDVTNNSNFLNSLVENHFSSSQKILDKKIQAYELLWDCILKIRQSFPAGISLVYQLMSDEQIEMTDAFETINNNRKMGPQLRKYDMDEEMGKMIDNSKPLVNLKPYISDSSYQLFHTYQGLIGRVTHQFIWDYSKEKLYNWKKDASLVKILKVTLSMDELKYVMSLKIMGLNTLTELIEYKILQDFRASLNIQNSTNDTVQYLKDLTTIVRKDFSAS